MRARMRWVGWSLVVVGCALWLGSLALSTIKIFWQNLANTATCDIMHDMAGAGGSTDDGDTPNGLPHDSEDDMEAE